MNFLRWLPAYRLMESMVVDSQRQVLELRADIEAERKTADDWKDRFEEEHDELKKIREKYEQSLIQTANFMAYAKTARMIFVPEDSNLPQPAPPVTNEQIRTSTHGRDLVAAANRKFAEELNEYANREAA